MPHQNLVPDAALSQALGVYAGMVSRVLRKPERWLGVDEDPPLTAGLPIRILDDLRDRVLGDVTPASPRWAALPESKRVDWWLRRIAIGAALAAAAPRFAGALADRLPLQAALGASAAGLAVCVVAHERGTVDPADWVPLLARILFDRDLTPGHPCLCPPQSSPTTSWRPLPATPRNRPAAWPPSPKVRSGSSGLCGAWPEPSSISRTCSTSVHAAASSHARWANCPSSASPEAGSTNAEPSAKQPDKPNDSLSDLSPAPASNRGTSAGILTRRLTVGPMQRGRPARQTQRPARRTGVR